MPLPSSGQITINQIHVEAGGGSGSQAAINDADIRDMIAKAQQRKMLLMNIMELLPLLLLLLTKAAFNNWQWLSNW